MTATADSKKQTKHRIRPSRIVETGRVVRAEKEEFIPLRKPDLLAMLVSELGEERASEDSFRELCRIIEATLHFEYHTVLENLKDLYAPFDPDRDTDASTDAPRSEDQFNEQADQLFNKFSWLMERANFRRLSRSDIEQVLGVASEWGVNVDFDFDVLDRLEVFARGSVTTARGVRRWKNFRREVDIEIPTFQRLVVAFRVRQHKRLRFFVNPNAVYIKLFKNIPHADLEMLLPGTRPTMRWGDRGKIVLPIVSGVGVTASKIAKIVLLGLKGPVGIAMLGAGAVGYGMRSVYGYHKTLQQYQLQLSQSLYFQSLGHNGGVMSYVLDEAEEQEFREAVLGYFFLWRYAPESGMTLSELDSRVEAFLEEKMNRPIDFEADDALEKLVRMQVVETLPNGRLRAKPIPAALTELDKAWDSSFEYHKPSAA